MATAADDDGFPSLVALEGVRLKDADRDVDAVRVTVAASQRTALLSMDPDLLGDADFNSYDRCFGQPGLWECAGDGLDDWSFTFVAGPSLADRLLQTLTYQSTKADTRDDVTVTVYDGEGGDCARAASPRPSLGRGGVAAPRNIYVSPRGGVATRPQRDHRDPRRLSGLSAAAAPRNIHVPPRGAAATRLHGISTL